MVRTGAMMKKAMVKFKFEKLVRDKLKTICEEKGGKVHYKILDDLNYIKALKEKLREEVDEMLGVDFNNKQIVLEELGDVYEILECIAQLTNVSVEEIQEAQLEKRRKNGGFKERYYFNWVEVIENNDDYHHLSQFPERYPILD